MEEIALEFFAEARFFQLLLGIASLIGLCVGILGFYGVGAYSILCRKQEFAIRFALGEGPRELLIKFARQGLKWMAWVAVVGLYSVQVTGNLLSSLFVVADRPDLGALLFAWCLLTCAGLAAFCTPAVSMVRAGGRQFVRDLNQ